MSQVSVIFPGKPLPNLKTNPNSPATITYDDHTLYINQQLPTNLRPSPLYTPPHLVPGSTSEIPRATVSKILLTPHLAFLLPKQPNGPVEVIYLHPEGIDPENASVLKGQVTTLDELKQEEANNQIDPQVFNRIKQEYKNVKKQTVIDSEKLLPSPVQTLKPLPQLAQSNVLQVDSNQNLEVVTTVSNPSKDLVNKVVQLIPMSSIKSIQPGALTCKNGQPANAIIVFEDSVVQGAKKQIISTIQNDPVKQFRDPKLIANYNEPDAYRLKVTLQQMKNQPTSPGTPRAPGDIYPLNSESIDDQEAVCANSPQRK